MKKKLIGIAVAIMASMSMVAAPVSAQLGVDIYGACDNSTSGVCADSRNQDVTPIIKKIVDFLLYLVGFLAVIMLIWGGITYATSAGDTTKVNNAKNTILYAVIGIIVAGFAYGIVQFVYDAVIK